MAKLRRNHHKQSSQAGNSIIKVGLFSAVIAGLFFVFNFFSGNSDSPKQEDDNSSAVTTTTEIELPEQAEFPEYFLPANSSGKLVKHTKFALSYSEPHEQAEWVAYELTKDMVTSKWFPRPNNFRPDPKVSSASASTRDYVGTGYDRGHLVPAGDMAYNETTISESFFMSNISPQIRNFNGGIWRELEENVRQWAKRFDHLYIVSGPLLHKNIRERIGGNNVSVPDAFFKVILDVTDPELKGIGFIIPNEVSVKPLQKYAVSIDAIEAETGWDFFPGMLETNLESQLESDFDIGQWPFSNEKYQERLQEWNKRK